MRVMRNDAKVDLSDTGANSNNGQQLCSFPGTLYKSSLERGWSSNLILALDF